MTRFRVSCRTWSGKQDAVEHAMTVEAANEEAAKRQALARWNFPRGVLVRFVKASRVNPASERQRVQLAYMQGRKAFNTGRSLAGCPYVRGSAIARAWADGWRDAEQRRSNPTRRKKKRPTGGDWNLDLWGGQGIEREGATRAEQLEIARDEMRRSGSGDMFDWLADQDKQRNPSAVDRLRALERDLDRALREARSLTDPKARARARRRAERLIRRHRSMRNPDDSAEQRYRRAVGHGETVATAKTAARNPGHATGRTAPNCPRCGALVRLPNPVPSRVTCASCGQSCMVRRP